MFRFLQPMTIETVRVDRAGCILERPTHQVYYYLEPLGDDLTQALSMIAIPKGKFLMGSTDGEGYKDETPQHKVFVPSFFMSRTPITQTQWHFVATLPQYRRSLNPNPSYFQGDNRPVEQVSWEDAVEFCARLMTYSGRSYRLPSEAEWEYACRAGTTTPFHVGETLPADLANYNDKGSPYVDGSPYANESTGQNRNETMPVASFPANAFGLCDMHGNVREWCTDHWHANYEGAPTDGRAWLFSSEPQIRSGVTRGGSWKGNAGYCRSALRELIGGFTSLRSDLGFRVVTTSRTPSIRGVLRRLPLLRSKL